MAYLPARPETTTAASPYASKANGVTAPLLVSRGAGTIPEPTSGVRPSPCLPAYSFSTSRSHNWMRALSADKRLCNSWASATERCLPPVQPRATVRYAFPSFW